MSSKIFENLYLKNAILEFLSGALIAFFFILFKLLLKW